MDINFWFIDTKYSKLFCNFATRIILKKIIMDKKTLRKIFLMAIFLMASIGFVSCSSSDDNDEPEPVPVIPELDQKLLNGIWISGDMEKGNLYTMQFTEDKVRTIVIANRKEY